MYFHQLGFSLKSKTVKNIFSFAAVFILCCFTIISNAQKQKPDTVKTGVYVTSIHDIDFKQKEYTLDLWLWLRYKNKKFDFANNLEIPQAKTVTRSFLTIDSSAGDIYMIMKLQCVMKDSWRIDNFPFDKQRLKLTIENSQYDLNSLVFEVDTLGQHYDPKFTLTDWNIDSCNVATGTKKYETAFGDTSYTKPQTEYSSFRLAIVLRRNASGLFWKMFTGMYIAFLLSYICFYIHADSIDSRYALTVGSLFAVIGNKYIIDSSLPESISYTLVDRLHSLTLLFIFLIVMLTTFSLNLVKKNQLQKAIRFDMVTAQIILVLYVIINLWYIYQATSS